MDHQFVIPGAPAALMARIIARRATIPPGMVMSAHAPEEPEPAGAKAEGGDSTDWKAESRKWERRAKENDEARKELDSIKEAQKSAEQKLAEREAEAERRAAEAEAKALRYEVAAEKGITKADADFFLHGSTREDLEAAADRLNERGSDSRKPVVPGQGTGEPKPKGSTYSTGRERALAKQNNS